MLRERRGSGGSGAGARGGRRIAVGCNAVGSSRCGSGLDMALVVTAQGRTLEQMLLLPAGVLCADLLAVDALDGQTLQRRSDGQSATDVLHTDTVWIPTLSSSLARNSTNAACTSWSTVRPIVLFDTGARGRSSDGSRREDVLTVFFGNGLEKGYGTTYEWRAIRGGFRFWYFAGEQSGCNEQVWFPPEFAVFRASRQGPA